MLAIGSALRMALVPGLLAALLLGGPAPAMANGTSPPPESTSLGAFEYQTFCASCHGAAGQGDGPIAAMLKVAPSNLTTLSQGNGGVFPRERITQFIDGRSDSMAHGSREMPVWGDWFTQQDLNDQLFLAEKVRNLSVQARIEGLVVYIESLQAK